MYKSFLNITGSKEILAEEERIEAEKRKMAEARKQEENEKLKVAQSNENSSKNITNTDKGFNVSIDILISEVDLIDVIEEMLMLGLWTNLNASKNIVDDILNDEEVQVIECYYGSGTVINIYKEDFINGILALVKSGCLFICDGMVDIVCENSIVEEIWVTILKSKNIKKEN